MSEILDLSELSAGGRMGGAAEASGILPQTAFERLLAELTAIFVSLPGECVDVEVTRGLKEISEFVDVDQTTLMEFSPDGSQLRHVHWYARPGIELAAGLVASEEFPWYAAQLRRGETLALGRLPDDLPAEAILARRYCLEHGLKSNLTIPLRVGGEVVSAIAFGSFTRFREWPNDLVSRLQLVGKVFARALAHWRADEALRASEQRFRTVADFCYDWEYWLAPDGRLVYVSPSCERITGYRPEEFLTDPGLLVRIAQEEDQARWAEHLRAEATTGPEAMDLRIATRAGELRWISHLCQPVFGSHGEYLGRRASSRDITDRKRMEARLLETAAAWQTTFNAVRDVVTILDREMKILLVNECAAEFYGRPPSQIIGQRCHILTHGTDHPVDGCPFAQAARTQRRAEAEIYDSSRERWLLVSIDPVLDGEVVTHFVHISRDITERKRGQLALEQAYRDIQQLQERLRQENLYLRAQTQPTELPTGIVGSSAALRNVLGQVEQVAKTNATVLITGESGTGKELIASAIHELSARRERVLVRVNCAALAPTLIESELFGREKGAYTGAVSKQLGRFELADGSTILLDEVGELPLELQAKLLRVLQEGTLERLGGPKTIPVNVRVVAASNRDLAQAVREGRFREDLFYRLNVFPIHLPPLRERPEDIPALVWAFVAEFGKSLEKTIEAIPRSTMEALKRYRWPGNIRELRNVVERAVILCEGSTLQVELPAASSSPRPRGRTLEEVERAHILDVLEHTGWRIRGPAGAAEILDINPTTLESRMAKRGIERRGKSSGIS